MRRLAQFVRLRLSRVKGSECSRLRASASVSRQGFRMLASACVCVCLASRVRLHLSRVCLASVSRLSRVKGSECSRLRASASVSRLACVCICLASVSRLSHVCLASRVPNARVCVRLRLSRVKGSECSRLRASASACVCVCLTSACVCICLASASVSRRSSCLASVCVCVCLASVSRRSSCLASVSRRSSCLASVCPCECLRELAHFMRRSSFKEFKRFFAIVILSYNVPMPKYPSHHLIYVFYHPMPIMPLY